MNGPQLSELPDDSEELSPHVSRLSGSALQAVELSAVTTFTDAFLLKFLRARDFDAELSLKVQHRQHTAAQNTKQISSAN